MRILWIKIGGLWPANVGGRLRSLHTLAALARRHRVTVVTTHGPDDDPAGLERELAACEQVISIPYVLPKRGEPRWFVALGRSWLSRLPVDLWKCRVPALEARVDALLHDAARPFDVCVADFLVATPNLPAKTSVPIVHFSHNVEHVLWQRLARAEERASRRALLELEWRKMRRCEARACETAQLTIAVSDADRAALERIAPRARVRSVATGVDTRFFHPDEAAQTPHSLVFTGAMDWYPNEEGILDFVAKTWPAVRRALPDATISVVGRNPSARLRAIDRNDGVHVTGTVPDVRPYVAQAELYVVPLRIGGGTRLKILEALAMGKAVVSTTIGAEGLPLVDGQHFVAADSSEEFARTVISLLRDAERRAALGRAGRRLVEQRHSWPKVAEQFEELCKEAIDHAS